MQILCKMWVCYWSSKYYALQKFLKTMVRCDSIVLVFEVLIVLIFEFMGGNGYERKRGYNGSA